MGRRGWGSARPPARRASGPGARRDGTAVPNPVSCSQQQCGAGRGGRQPASHPVPPPPPAAEWWWCAGQLPWRFVLLVGCGIRVGGKMMASVPPYPPEKGVWPHSGKPCGRGLWKRGVPLQTPPAVPCVPPSSDWCPPGQAGPLSSARLKGLNPARPHVRGGSITFLAWWRGCGSCPRPPPARGTSAVPPETGALLLLRHPLGPSHSLWDWGDLWGSGWGSWPPVAPEHPAAPIPWVGIAPLAHTRARRFGWDTESRHQLCAPRREAPSFISPNHSGMSREDPPPSSRPP